jgi:hypothetical protein
MDCLKNPALAFSSGKVLYAKNISLSRTDYVLYISVGPVCRNWQTKKGWRKGPGGRNTNRRIPFLGTFLANIGDTGIKM